MFCPENAPAAGVGDAAPACAIETEFKRQVKIRIDHSKTQDRVWKSNVIATLVWRIIGFDGLGYHHRRTRGSIWFGGRLDPLPLAVTNVVSGISTNRQTLVCFCSKKAHVTTRRRLYSSSEVTIISMATPRVTSQAKF
jgi:hypothetical protein